MKLPTQPFVSRFVGLARQQLGQPQTAAQTGLSEAREAARLLGAETTLRLSQEAALSLVDGPMEQAEGRIHDEFLRAEPAGEPVLKIWQQLQALAGTHLPQPKVADSILVDLGAQAGDQVFLDHKALPLDLADPNHLAFVMAHEMGHVVHRDSTRRAGLSLALELFSSVSDNMGPAFRQASRQMELEADGFAANLMRGMTCDSGTILDRLLRLTAGKEHPDGLARAEVVRGFLPVADEVWGELLARNASSRAASQGYEEDEARLRKMMAAMR